MTDARRRGPDDQNVPADRIEPRSPRERQVTPFGYRTVSEDLDLETVAGLLHDESARTILTATSVEPMSANELSERCDVSPPTVYRWTERLQAAGLIAERTRPRSDGHHDAVYVATFEELSVRLEDGSMDVEIDFTDGDDGVDVADRLTEMWEDL